MSDLPLTGDAILALIPQRSPIVMVDSLLAYGDDFVQSAFEIKAGNLFLQEGQLQEGGLLEHMAQSVAMHTGYGYFLRNEQAPTGYIGAIPKAEIFDLPRLGDILETEVRVVQEFMGVTLVDVETKLSGNSIAKAQMKTVIAPNP